MKSENPRRPRVVVESPYRGDTDDPHIWERNMAYAHAAMIDSLRRGEAPFLSHLLYPLVLNDGISHQRATGLEAAQAWIGGAESMAVYEDHGISEGMAMAIEIAKELGLNVVYRKLYNA